jgi:proteasome lid subunit RPN8/RPN11
MKQILKNIKRKCLGSLIECCGYIISQGDKRIKVMPCKNMAIHPHLRFEIGPYDTIEAFEEGDIIACYHSHPTDNDNFSEEDLRNSKSLKIPFVLYCEKNDTFKFFDGNKGKVKKVFKETELRKCLNL